MPDDTRALRGRMAEVLIRDVHRAAEDLLGEATRRAPVDEGTLRGSGAVVLSVNGQRFEGDGAIGAATAAAIAAARAGTGVNVEAEVSFNTVYAARQHEETTWQHPKGGQAKYLESALHERAHRYDGLIAAGQRKVM